MGLLLLVVWISLRATASAGGYRDGTGKSVRYYASSGRTTAERALSCGSADNATADNVNSHDGAGPATTPNPSCSNRGCIYTQYDACGRGGNV